MMKFIFALIVFIHGLIHILGFVKGFGFKEVKELTLPISKTMGLLWLTTAVLIVLYSILHYASTNYAWLIGFIAIALSQTLIILFWKDAKYGTWPNIAIMIVLIIAYGDFRFQKNIQLETMNILGKLTNSNERIITENDIRDLPKAVKKWLYRSGVIGKPHISTGKVIQQAEMKMRPEQDNWYIATAIQYSTIDVPAFIWSVNVRVNSLLSFQGRDKFENGKSEMLIKLNSLINVVNEKGEKLDEGSLQRYLGEMVCFPSLAISPYITWQEINDTTAYATMEYKGTKGSGIFYFNSEGDVIQYSALRFMGNEPDAKRYEWVISVNEYKTFEGIKVPSKMAATWKLENKDWTWLKLEIKDIKFNKNVFNEFP